MHIHYLIHVPEELPGAIATWANEKKLQQTYTLLYENAEFPAIESFDILVIMGGPMNIYEHEKYPWLPFEKQFIRSSIDANKKVLGICLGAQIIADVLGAKVVPNLDSEIGWFPVQKTNNAEAHPLLKSLELNTVLHWHGDRFEIPKNAIHLIQSAACKQQAFLYKNNVLAFQFHIEMTSDNLKKMIDLDRKSLVKSKWVMTEEELLKGAENIEQNNQLLFSILNRFTV